MEQKTRKWEKLSYSLTYKETNDFLKVASVTIKNPKLNYTYWDNVDSKSNKTDFSALFIFMHIKTVFHLKTFFSPLASYLSTYAWWHTEAVSQMCDSSIAVWENLSLVFPNAVQEL